MTELSQQEHVGKFSCPLGPDKLVLSRFDGFEALSELFEFRFELLSETEGIDFDSLLGCNCHGIFKSPDGPDRIFNGVLVEAQWVGTREDLSVYNVVLRPWFWLLSRTSDCRIWHDKTASDIIEEVFRDRGFTSFKNNAKGPFPKLEYCVQYRETDFSFVSRLMEQHGIYYFFQHDESDHHLVMADSYASHSPIPGHATMKYFANAQSRRDQEHFNEWTPERRFSTGKYQLNDYDFKKPTSKLDANKEANSSYRHGKMEIYDYPGKYVTQDDGMTYARVRLEADQAQDKRRYAGGNAVSAFPGALVTLEQIGAESENKQYLILRANHTFVSQGYRSGGGGEDDYFGSYELLDSSIPYRAPLATPKPIIYGPQTAKVVGQDGEEIDVDEWGRILVRFYWDRKNMNSCRLRVAQVWSGKQWGGQFIPRIGMEAVVEFLEGDPDRPLVVGAVYNGDNKHPYTVPDDKTQSGFKSDSSIGHNGYNEFMFEDKKKSEKIRMHGQKDHEVTILNTETWTIGEKFEGGKDDSRTTTLVKGSDEVTIKSGNQILTIEDGDRTVKISDNWKATVDKSIKFVCGGSSIEMTPSTIKISSGQISITAPEIDWN